MKKILTILITTVILLSTLITSFAANNAEAYTTDKPNARFSEEKKLICVEESRIDLGGNLLTERNIAGISYLDVKFWFYDMGESGGKHAYEVQMEASGTPDVTISYSKFSAKPKNNKTYLDSVLFHPNLNIVSDAIYYEYPDAGPTSPTCSVKATIITNMGTTNVPAKTLKSPK